MSSTKYLGENIEKHGNGFVRKQVQLFYFLDQYSHPTENSELGCNLPLVMAVIGQQEKLVENFFATQNADFLRVMRLRRNYLILIKKGCTPIV